MSALSAYRVLDLSEGVGGEYCAKLIADFGAEVIKIEPPDGGSPTRRLGPFASNPLAATQAANESSGLFAYLNTNKHSVTLNLGTGAGRQTLAELLEHVDVVIDDHQSGWLGQLGLDPQAYQDRWPGLIVCSVTAYGQNPPQERRHATDLTVFHSSGWGYHTPGGGYDEQPPLKGPGRFLVSYEAGMEAAMYVAAALIERQESGKGQFIDVSKYEVMASRADYVLAQFVAGEMDVRTDRGAYDLAGPGGIFACRDGFVYAWLAMPAHWEALRQLLDDTEWMDDFPERWLELGLTPERVALCRKHLGAWAKTQNKDEAAEQAQKLGLTLVAVNYTRDLIASPQYDHRQFFHELAHPVLGQVLYPTVPYKLSETPAKINSPAPLLGQHTETWLQPLSEGS